MLWFPILLWGQSEKEVFIADLLAQMTVEEKIGQMTNLGVTALVAEGFWTDADSLVLHAELMDTYIKRFGVGSFQGKGVYPPTSQEWLAITTALQQYATRETRLGIPLLIGIDAVHGSHYTREATIFPHQIGLGATLDTALVYRIAQATSTDLLASGIGWNFSPVLDLAWQPLWGRIEETFSADAYVTAALGAAYVAGAQSVPGVKVCLKHLAGYSFPFSGKDRSPVYLAPTDLHQFFLPPFRAAIGAGAATIMLNSGIVNGIPGHVDQVLIDQVKSDWGFDGFMVSDWDDLTKLVTVHHVAANYKEATRLAVLAGMDMCMVPYDSTFSVNLLELVQENAVPESRIDDAVARILGVKYDLGLWKPQPRPVLERHDLLALEAATKSMVLLQNDGVLPLLQEENIVLAGPGAHRLTALNGPWSRTWKGDAATYDHPEGKTILQALEAAERQVTYLPGADYDSLAGIDWSAALAGADKILLVLGEAPSTEKNSDIHDLHLPEAQQELIRQVHATGKPYIIVLLQGRPRLLSSEAQEAGAIIHAFYPGEMGGVALDQLLYGYSNFSGKLPYTYPKHSGHLAGYPYRGSDQLDASFGMEGYPPLYPFGHGKSYTSFTYNNLTCSDTVVGPEHSLTCSITVQNTGKVTGRESVQWYLKDEVASVSPVLWRMVGFQNIELAPGQQQTLTFVLPDRSLQLVDRNQNWSWESGYFQLGVGPDSENLQPHRFFLDMNME